MAEDLKRNESTENVANKPIPGQVNKTLEDKTRLLTYIFAIISFLISFYVYASTAQITTSFWDCGEFIATSYILGVPHPPGAPFINIVYRLASILPIPGEIAWRVNLASGFGNALGIGVLFLIIAKALRTWFIKVRDWADISIIISGAFVGSLLAAFGSTYWFNGVEAEVYGPAMFCLNLVIYLALLWKDHHLNPKSDRYLVLIAFVLYLSMGIHLTVLIILPVLFIFFIMNDREKRFSPIFWGTWIILFSVAIGFKIFLILMISGLVISITGLIFSSLSQNASNYKRQWLIAFVTLLVAVTAYTVNSYTIIRSKADPFIDENNPETWADLENYMDRKQYGQESMWEKMFTRRAKWKNQFGTHRRMGFWGFYWKQYTNDPKDTFYGIIPFILALFGMYYMFAKNKKMGLYLFLITLVGTVGLIIYINFADGTVPPDHLEVRDRDYFFTPGYMYLSAFTGIGLAAILSLFNYFRREGNLPAFLTSIIAVVFMAIPAIPLQQNWFKHDRSRNWIPRDYAYNILQSCDENAILFTNGDNDTFPLWFLQAVEGVRTDVIVANLSLLNTPWYILQLKNNLGVDIQMSDNKIKNLRAFRDPDNPENIIRVQDIMVQHIIKNSSEIKMAADSSLYFDPPVYFAVTVAPDNKLYFDKYLKMNGLAYKMTTEAGERQVDIPLMQKNLYSTYLYRGLTDSTIYKDENSDKLMQNYITAFMTLSMSLENEGDTLGSVEAMDTALTVLPFNWHLYAFAGDIYSKAGMVDRIEKLYDEAVRKEPENNKLISMFSHFHRRMGNEERAREILEKAYEKYPDNRDFMMDLVRLYYIQEERAKMESVLTDWKMRYPDDEELNKMMRPTSENTVIQPTTADGKPKVMSVPKNQPATQAETQPK
ncbi:MAG: protein O-mannosyl-transferase family [Candidatus Zixiibacteriota bacterium]